MDILKKLLYYPYISIPNAAWLKQALLYWDGIATIVPTDCLNNNKYFTRFARNVVRQGIIETVSPDDYAYSYPNEYLKFLDWAIENTSHFPIEENRFNNSSVTKQYNIHTGKISFIGSELEKCGLAHRIDNQWYAMNSKLSMSFMTFLLKNYSAITEALTEIFTVHNDEFKRLQLDLQTYLLCCHAIFGIRNCASQKHFKLFQNIGIRSGIPAIAAQLSDQ